MKKVIILTQIFTIALLVYCGIFLYFNGNIDVSLLKPEITSPLWILKAGSFVAGVLAGISICGIYTTKQSEKFSALERRSEKKEIKADDNEAKIRVLENKIASLEKALDKALGK